MPFDLKGLNRLDQLGNVGNNAPPSLWTYATPDTHATVIAAGYFNAQAAYMRVGDIIIAITSTGGTPVARMYVVTGQTVTTVTITAVTGASWT